MGRQDKITPDIIEWLVSDDKVVSRWKEVAHRLNLDPYVARIDENYSYRRKKFEKQKMKELLEVWRRASPITFTRSRLMDVLNKEGLTDMHMWLQLMGTEDSPRKSEISQMLQLGTPRSSLSPSPNYHLLSSAPATTAAAAMSNGGIHSASYRSLPSSPYSWFFESSNGDVTAGGSSGRASSGLSYQSGPMSVGGAPVGNGILKKRPASDYSFYTITGGGGGGRSSTDSAGTTASRESTPDDSLSRPMSGLSVDGSVKKPASSVTSSTTSKTIRFADELAEVSCAGGSIGRRKDSERSRGNGSSSGGNCLDEVDDWLKCPRKGGGADQSVEKYFDNLITMIEDAAEGL